MVPGRDLDSEQFLESPRKLSPRDRVLARAGSVVEIFKVPQASRWRRTVYEFAAFKLWI